MANLLEKLAGMQIPDCPAPGATCYPQTADPCEMQRALTATCERLYYVEGMYATLSRALTLDATVRLLQERVTTLNEQVVYLNNNAVVCIRWDTSCNLNYNAKLGSIKTAGKDPCVEALEDRVETLEEAE